MSDDFEKMLLGGGAASAGPQDVPLFLQDEPSSNPPARCSAKLGSSREGGTSEFLSLLDNIAPSASVEGTETAANGATAAVQQVRETIAESAPPALSSAESLHFISLCSTSGPDGIRRATTTKREPAKGVVYNLTREKILGKGNFGCATLYTNHGESIRNRRVVVKDVNLQAMRAERTAEVDSLVNEIALLREVKGHPNCLYLFDYFSSSSTSTEVRATANESDATGSDGQKTKDLQTFRQVLLEKNTKMAYLLTELCEAGDLGGLIEQKLMSAASTAALSNKYNKKYFSESFVASVLIQLLMALHYLHDEKKIIHRDVKPQNLFFREDGVSLRLGDFGIGYSERLSGNHSVNYSSAQLNLKKGKNTATSSTDSNNQNHNSNHNNHAQPCAGGVNKKEVKGTPFYMAPELFQERSSYTFAVDIWSAAVLLYELIALEKPFLSSNYASLSQLVTSGHCLSLTAREDLERDGSHNKPSARPLLKKNEQKIEKKGEQKGEQKPENGDDAENEADAPLFSRELLELVMSMLVTDPQRRPSARRLLRSRYVARWLCRVPKKILATAAYRTQFGEEAVTAAQRHCEWDGVDEIVEETPRPLLFFSSSFSSSSSSPPFSVSTAATATTTTETEKKVKNSEERTEKSLENVKKMTGNRSTAHTEKGSPSPAAVEEEYADDFESSSSSSSCEEE